MKKIKTTITILSLSFFTSCSDFLEVDPIGKTTISVFFSDMDGIRAALPGAYSKVYDYYGDEFLLYPDTAGDMLQLATAVENNMISQYNFTSNPAEEITAVGMIWRNALEALVNVNNMLEYQPALLEKFPSNEQELTQIKAEALFLRALIHFDLVRVYAQPYNYTNDASHLGVPVLTKTPSSDDHVPRKTVNEVYQQIEKDLKEAALLFENSDDATSSFYASKNAVHALLARMYLYMENWEQAINYASLVIDSTPLSQGQDYLDMFLKIENDDESLFKLNGNLKTPYINKFYNQETPLAIASTKLTNLLNENTEDIRLDLIDTETLTSLKFLKPFSNIGEIKDNDYHIIVLRASEMYLIRAEAYTELSNIDLAKEDLKILMARNYQTTTAAITLNKNTQEELKTLIDKERSKELCFEGHRLYDITRTQQNLIREANTTSTVKEITYPSTKFVLPIPQKEMDVNKAMIQNDGY
ncbi:RagB/SusD family nutrient uptake outer membrane protein [Ochrovirga pacifica]|uniref:RagB/SusD family nutrient uptake outer membrane protein n=1 Tax=Ochrovirga pacifica TaxID=1042376 RepID=UPI000255879A|nr:RagB/SusD family nutrient uptake outer membrane protein [Ochrovirga pacifica]